MLDNDGQTLIEEREELVESLIDKAEDYVKTNFAILRLEAVQKSSNVASTVISKAIAWGLVLFFVFMGSIALAIWLGELTGSLLYGFLIVTAFYGLMALVIGFAFNKEIKQVIMNTIIKNALD